MPVCVNKYVVLIEISEGENERSTSKVSAEKKMETRPAKLLARMLGRCGVSGAYNCIGSVSETTVMTPKDISNIRVDRRVGIVPWYIGWDSFIFQILHLKRKRTIAQAQESVVVDNEGPNPWQRNSCDAQ
jgi:hypothetical protein